MDVRTSDPDYFLGGEMELADGFIDIVTTDVTRGIRVVTVESGHDPREFARAVSDRSRSAKPLRVGDRPRAEIDDATRTSCGSLRRRCGDLRIERGIQNRRNGW